MFRSLLFLSIIAFSQCQLRNEYVGGREWGDYPFYYETVTSNATEFPDTHSIHFIWESEIDRFTQVFIETNEVNSIFKYLSLAKKKYSRIFRLPFGGVYIILLIVRGEED